MYKFIFIANATMAKFKVEFFYEIVELFYTRHVIMHVDLWWKKYD
jgi:hypothetical protein